MTPVQTLPSLSPSQAPPPPPPPPPAAAAAVGPPQLTETQKALVDDDAAQSLEQQESMNIKGSNQRHMIMQKLMRKTSEVRMHACSDIINCRNSQ